MGWYKNSFDVVLTDDEGNETRKSINEIVAEEQKYIGEIEDMYNKALAELNCKNLNLNVVERLSILGSKCDLMGTFTILEDG